MEMNPLKLAFITSQAFSIVNFRDALCRELVRQNIKVYALAPDYDDTTRAAVIALGVEPVDFSMSRTGMNPVRDVFDLMRLVFLLKNLKPNITFAYFIKPVIYGTLAARLAKVEKRIAMIEGAGFVFVDEDKMPVYRYLLRIFTTLLYRFSLRYATKVFLLNPDDKKLFVEERKMVSANKVQLLNGIGVDLNYYKTETTMVAPSSVCFILVARLLREKGVYDYVTAARKVKILNPSVRFVLLGNIDVNPGSVKSSEVQKWIAEGIIECPGHVSDVRTWLATANVFVLPSYREGVPRSTQEAMAMGKPIITTDVPGCRETVMEGVNGFLIPPHNPDTLVKKMLLFVDNPELIVSMGTESRRLAEKKFDIHKINALILDSLDL